MLQGSKHTPTSQCYSLLSCCARGDEGSGGQWAVVLTVWSGFAILESQSWISVCFLLSSLSLPGSSTGLLQQLLFGMADSSAQSGLGKAVHFPTVVTCCQICSLSCWENEIR